MNEQESFLYFCIYLLIKQIVQTKHSIVKVYTRLNELNLNEPVVTIGVFDGVHKGHRLLIEKLILRARKLKRPSLLITLWPHPRIVLNKDPGKLRLLNTIEEKKFLLSKIGVENLLIIPFTRDFASQSSCQFIENYLVKKINVKHLVVGFDHHFGKNREGSYDYLKSCASKFGFTIEKIDSLSISDNKVSSTLIRKELEKGNIESANKYLGYEYYISGTVIEGQKIGRKIGFPTANIRINETFKQIPKDGVYAVKVRIGDEKKIGMLNIGIRPTLNMNKKEKTIEVHIINFQHNIYNEKISITFLHKIRDEKKFKDISELTSQLYNDKKTVLQLFNE